MPCKYADPALHGMCHGDPFRRPVGKPLVRALRRPRRESSRGAALCSGEQMRAQLRAHSRGRRTGRLTRGHGADQELESQIGLRALPPLLGERSHDTNVGQAALFEHRARDLVRLRSRCQKLVRFAVRNESQGSSDRSEESLERVECHALPNGKTELRENSSCRSSWKRLEVDRYRPEDFRIVRQP